MENNWIKYIGPFFQTFSWEMTVVRKLPQEIVHYILCVNVCLFISKDLGKSGLSLFLKYSCSAHSFPCWFRVDWSWTGSGASSPSAIPINMFWLRYRVSIWNISRDLWENFCNEHLQGWEQQDVLWEKVFGVQKDFF